MRTSIYISAIASVSALGSTKTEIWQNYLSKGHPFIKTNIEGNDEWIASLPTDLDVKIDSLKKSNATFQKLDRSVLLAILSSRALQINDSDRVGVNIGSSRGATHLFEDFHSEFLDKGQASTLTSPTTTLGNISSWVAQDLNAHGPVISHSVTCSTALHSILNAIAWMSAGMADSFVVGGAEAPLTPFTISQMKALKLYSKSSNDFPCESLNLSKKSNTMILGEGAALAYLEKERNSNTVGKIVGYGFASETLEHPISLTSDAKCFQDSMTMALHMAELENVDAIVMHAPGTVKGDLAEMTAIEKIFRNKTPKLTTNKVLVGHTLGASGMLSIEMAILMLHHNKFIENPFYTYKKDASQRLETVMINAVGFGGNAVSIIVTK